MAARSGGQLVVEALQREGVTRIFSLSGGVLNPIYDACLAAGIEIVHTRHEGGAGFMADGWARATGQPGVCLVTLGPGVTNTITPMLTALEAGSPMLVLAGQAPLARWDQGAAQAAHHLPLVQAAAKWSRTVLDTARIPEYIGSAYREALAGRPGPVFLDLPGNVIYGQADPPAPAGTYRTAARAWPDPTDVARAAELLASAERPLVVAGAGVWWSQAAAEVAELVELTGLPMLTARMGRGSLPRDHELHFGLASIADNRVAEAALRETDCLLMLGERFDYYFEFGQPPHVNASARVIQVDPDRRQIGWNRGVELGIAADVKATLGQLNKALREQPAPKIGAWRASLASERSAFERELAGFWESDAAPMHPIRLVHGVLETVEREAILVTGHGDVDFWADILFEPNLPGGYLRAGQTGALGAEIPFAIAAKMARPERQVVVLLGDGAFGFHGFELEVAATHGANVLCVIGNDAGWGATKHQQEIYYGDERVYATTTEFRRYEQVVEALGGYGELVERPSELRPALERALASGKPACVNVVMASETSPFIARYAARRA
jgi:acetolactate synthase-1/2/3 large subunit